MGYNFFKNHPTKIDFENHKITVYNENFFNESKFKSSKTCPFQSKTKALFNYRHSTKQEFFPAKMLLDLGNSDALWLFPNRILISITTDLILMIFGKRI
jgi:hypothetical protein